MNSNEFALELNKTIKQLKAEGVDSIDTEKLIAYLDDAEGNLESQSESNIELYKANLQQWLEEHKNANAHSVEMFRSVISAGQNALRTSFLMNGGASVATLAFIGHLATTSPEKVTLFSTSLAFFVLGVLVSAITSGVTYLSQWLYASDSKKAEKAGFVLNVAAIVLGIGSYVIFAFGINEAHSVFSNFI